ncbi:MAG: ABC transporter substrate-binding protein [Bacillota bacterium]|nr:ABC transporter substrate-binding protein [Bacillota bacterium]
MKKKLCLFLAIMLLIALPLSACGGGEVDEPEEDQEPAEGEKNEEPVVLRIGIIQEADSTSPLIATMTAADRMFNLMYDDLIEYDDNYRPVGGLAEDWLVSDDGLIWTFNLKEGIKWFDGEDFNADDVVWTYNTIVNGEFPQSPQMEGITKTIKVDEYTVEVHTEAPKADMEAIRVNILPEHIYGEKSEDELHTFSEDNPVGTGAFELVNWEQGQFLRFKANPNYFKGAPQIDEIVYVLFANTDTLFQALQNGEIDAVAELSYSQVEQAEALDGIEVIQPDGMNFTELGFNCWEAPESKGNPLMLDHRIRAAIDTALDKQQIVDIALNGYGVPGTSLIPPAVGDYHFEVDDDYGYNPEKAMEILEDAGYTDTDGDGIREDSEGNKLDFRFAVITSYGEAYVKAAGIIQKNLQDIGINVTINTMDGGAQSELIYEQDFDTDMYLWGWGAELDPSMKLSVMTTDQVGKRSDCFWSNEEYDELFEKQINQVDREERIETVHKMQQIILEEAPYSILYYRNIVEAYRTDKFEGWTRVPEGSGSAVTQVNKSTVLNIRPK